MSSTARRYASIALCVLLTGCAAATRASRGNGGLLAPAGETYLKSDSVRAELREIVYALASDEMEGREAATAGEERAALYIADKLRMAGVQPAGDLTDMRSYLQEFDVRGVRFDTSLTRLVLHDHPAGRLKLGDEWVGMPQFSPEVAMDTLEVVFAGYGITAIEQGHDDYAILDAAGKIVIAVGGAPADLDSITTFGETFAPGDLITKWISAAMQGAAALLMLEFDPVLSSWDAFANLSRSSSLELVDDEDLGVPIMPYLFLSENVGRSLLDEISDSTADGFPVPGPTSLRMGLHLAPRQVTGKSRNVVGYLPGTSSPHRYVALGAHLDHLGIDEEGIFNGADDDASGVAAVLAAARAFALDAASGRRTDRSLLFVFHGAEEKGLLGAQFFTSSPARSVLTDLNEIVTQINLDMVGRESRDSLHVLGADRMSTELGEIVLAANSHLGSDSQPLFVLDRSFDHHDDPEKTFERSDHFRYAVRGVPVIFLTDGMGSNWAKGTDRDDYHRVTDDPEKIDYEKLRRVAELAYEIARRAARNQAALEVDGFIPVDTR